MGGSPGQTPSCGVENHHDGHQGHEAEQQEFGVRDLLSVPAFFGPRRTDNGLLTRSILCAPGVARVVPLPGVGRGCTPRARYNEEAMTVYEQVKKALQDIVAPELNGIKVEIRRLDEKIGSLRNELLAEIKRVDSSLLAEIGRVDARVESLQREVGVALEIRERLSALEAKVGILRG